MIQTNAPFVQNMEEENFSNDILMEACVETFEQAVRAEQNGAHRIELCSNLEVGGLTPSERLIEKVVKKIGIPVMAMVRPRPGNFVFSEEEMKSMVSSIAFMKSIGLYGIVIGNLNQYQTINIPQTQRLCHVAEGLSVTFHKAIDETIDLLEAVKTLSRIDGIDRILTSGGAETALTGAEKIKEMMSVAGDRMKIISAGKINTRNLKEVHQKIKGKEYHGRRIVF